MTRTRYYVAILMMGMFYLLMTTPAQAATLNVDQNDPNCSDSSGGPYCTIQAAIDAASANDTIEIASGVYAEFLSVDKPLTLSGPNAGTPGYWSPRTDEAIIVPPDNSHAQAIIRVVADDVTIDGVTVDGNNPNLSGSIDINGVDVNASTGIIVPNYEDSCGNNFQNITIRNNIIQNLNWYGFYGGGCPGNNSTLSENNLIEYNYVDNMPNRTVAVGPIQGDRGRRGIGFYNEFHATVQNNEITRVLRGIQNGATFVNTSGTYYIQNNTISSSGIGIWHNLWSSGTPPYIIRDNTLTSDDGPSGGNSGIAISSISGNATFTNNHVTNSDEGIFLRACLLKQI